MIYCVLFAMKYSKLRKKLRQITFFNTLRYRYQNICTDLCLNREPLPPQI